MHLPAGIKVKIFAVKFLICFILILPFCGEAQTKKETEEWILYYLNKYCSSDYSYERYKSYIARSDQPYTWKVSEYSFFTDSTLRIKETEDTKDKEGHIGFSNTTITDINLSRVIKIKIQVANSIVFKENNHATLCFEFRQPEYTINHELTSVSVDQWDALTGKPITEKGAYALGYNDIKSFDAEAVEDNIFERLKKAFEYQISLVGSGVLKKVF
jgi:hypothetical protein